MQSIQIGLTHEHTCSYLPSQKERVAVAVDSNMHTDENYEVLLANGFRRSGETVYSPYCIGCSQCQALRVDASLFTLTKSQKRLRNKTNHLYYQVKPSLDKNWFPLYASYITKRHRDGIMYPPDKQDFAKFSSCAWLTVNYLHIYEEDELLAIAVMDILPHSASAFYTFYSPDSPLSLGSLAILYQLEFCKLHQKQWLYLGYQIDSCPAMNYKVHFHPHQRLVNQRWRG